MPVFSPKGNDYGDSYELDKTRSKLTGREAEYTPKYKEFDFITYNLSEDKESLSITSGRTLNYRIGTDKIEYFIEANAAILNTVISNMTKYLTGKTNPSVYFQMCKDLIEKVMEMEKK